MGQPELKTIELPDEDSCAGIAGKLLTAVLDRLPEDRAFVVHLSGPLGAGKTTLARAMLRAAGVSGRIRSPTYTLVETYETAAGVEFVHIDLYRIGDTAEAEGLGLREYDRPGVIWLVEWPERAAISAQVDILVELAHAEPGRHLSLTGQSAIGVEGVTAAFR